MPGLKFLCLHGSGTSSEIFRSQLGPLIEELSKDGTANFHIIEGELATDAGPGIGDFFEGPYFNFFNWPPTAAEADEDSIADAYELLYEVIEEEGPFDGILGFSHGGNLAANFLAHHERHHPGEPLVRCAVFMNSLAPFRVDGEGKRQPHEEDAAVVARLQLPSVHVVGEKDFIHDYSMEFWQGCKKNGAQLVMTSKGHEVPRDGKDLSALAGAIRDLQKQVVVY